MKQEQSVPEITILVTGGAGFIGCNVIRYLLQNTPHRVVNVDKLSYAGNLESLADVADDPRYSFLKLDIGNAAAMERVLAELTPTWVMHLAAESHVDRSIDSPGSFVQTNVVGTCTLLQAAHRHWYQRSPSERSAFRFLHVSTDEVFGSLSSASAAFTEATAYDPRSPYSASKAASDHFARAWFHTYGLPVLVTNCSNNYGPYQFPEKLVPTVILKALRGDPIPVYGTGENVRDWLYVEDHARALVTVLESGVVGQTYNIGGANERKNLDLVHLICSILDELCPRKDSRSYAEQISFVTDRPGHDLRYAINAQKIRSSLGWTPHEDPESGFRRTVQWYVDHQGWCSRVLMGDYRLERQGLNPKRP